MKRIKDRIKTIIDDYSVASHEAETRRMYNGFFKGTKAAESLWTYGKDPFLLRIKGLLARIREI